MAASIITDQLTKYYDNQKVPSLHKLSIEVQPGEVYGFLGANGAGKTTTIRLLLNFLQPSSGKAQIMGLDTVKNSVEVKKHVGYLSGELALYPKPTGRQLLDLLSSFQPHKSDGYRSTLEKRFNVELDKPIGTLSKGNRQKIGIIQAFMTQPQVLILDEPTSGLDPLMQEAFYETIEENKQRGTAILMSSHNLTEAQRICDRVGIIKGGKLILEQEINENTSLNSILFKVTLTHKSDVSLCKSTPGLTFISQVADSVILKPENSIKEALKALGQFDIKEFSTQNMDLENEFIEFYGDRT